MGSDLSMRQRFARLPQAAREEWLSQQDEQTLIEIARMEWWWTARPSQVPPDGPQMVNLFLAGRGSGKSKSGSEWIVSQIQKHQYDSLGVPTEWLVIAETLGDARAVCLEGPAGILRSLERQKIVYKYVRSPRPMIFFPDGQKIYCEGGNDPDVGRGYNAAGAWCVCVDEPILTDRGEIPVQDVRIGDRVLTSQGWLSVRRSGLTRRQTEVLEIQTEAGSVRVTPDHQVWCEELGWVRADSIPIGATMDSWKSSPIPFLPKLLPTWSGMAKPGTTTSARATTTTVRECCSIVRCGSKPTVRYQMASKSTTSIASGTTTGWPTSNSSPRVITPGSLLSSGMTQPGLVSKNQKQPVSVFASIGNAASHETWSAWNAEASSSPLECEPSSAPLIAAPETLPERRRTSVLAVVKVSQPADVYDISVDGVPEFYAGSGLLKIHNCDETAKWVNAYASWYEGIMPSLRAPLINDHPRAFVTTTPKPDKLLIDWLARQDGSVHLIRGTTFDNAHNLSAQVITEMKLRYDGTTLGRQELYGEMLDALDGALFKKSDIELHRVHEVPDNMITIVVGVDPSLTDEGDEMGVIVLGRTRDNHIYCLEDATRQMVGREAARHCWKVLTAWGADVLVLEENLGKRWMQQVFRDAYFELVGEGQIEGSTTPPLHLIDARVGKRTRGEPVAMRMEQGRLHHVGEFPDLEEQLSLFTGWDGKESPDRLDAYVHAARFLMKSERKRAKISSPLDYMPRLDALNAY